MQPSELEAIRDRLGLRQEDLANLIGMSRNTISRMEKGRMSIERRTAWAVLYLSEHPELITQSD